VKFELDAGSLCGSAMDDSVIYRCSLREQNYLHPRESIKGASLAPWNP